MAGSRNEVNQLGLKIGWLKEKNHNMTERGKRDEKGSSEIFKFKKNKELTLKIRNYRKGKVAYKRKSIPHTMET